LTPFSAVPTQSLPLASSTSAVMTSPETDVGSFSVGRYTRIRVPS